MAKRFYCHYCNRPIYKKDIEPHDLRYTIDHVWPKNLRTNWLRKMQMVACCLKCNGMKGDCHPDLWNEFMKQNPRWWKLQANACKQWLRSYNREEKACSQ